MIGQTAISISHFDHGLQTHQTFVYVDNVCFQSLDISIQSLHFIGQFERVE